MILDNLPIPVYYGDKFLMNTIGTQTSTLFPIKELQKNLVGK